MSDIDKDKLPGEPGTAEGETEHSESDPVAPSVEGREQPSGEEDSTG